MLRLKMIWNYIYKFCSNLTAEEIINNPYIGIFSLDISENLNILRNNASSDLNKLYKDGILIKIKEKSSSNKIVKSITKEISIDITCDAVNKYLTILSGDKIKCHILEFINIIETELNIDIANSSLSKIFIHVSCVIERILLKDFVLTSHEEISSYKKKMKNIFL